MVYTVFFFLLLIGYVNNKGHDRFLLACSLFLWLVIGLRHVECFSDTEGYVMDFDYIKKMGVESIIKECAQSREPLYLFITWISSFFSSRYPIFLLFWAIFPALAIYKLFKTELTDSKDFSLGFLILFMIGLFAFFCTGIRQTAAMSVILLGYRFMKNIIFPEKGKLKLSDVIKFSVCFVIAFFIHNTSILFLAAFLIRFMTFRSAYILIALGAFALGNFVNLEQFLPLTSMLLGDHFDIYGTTAQSELSMSGYFIQLLMFGLCYFKRKELISNSKENEYFLNMALVGLLFQSLTGMLGEMFRVAFYFNIFTIILIPRALKFYRLNKNGKMIEFAFIAACVVYLFFLSSSNMPRYWSSL